MEMNTTKAPWFHHNCSQTKAYSLALVLELEVELEAAQEQGLDLTSHGQQTLVCPVCLTGLLWCALTNMFPQSTQLLRILDWLYSLYSSQLDSSELLIPDHCHTNRCSLAEMCTELLLVCS